MENFLVKTACPSVLLILTKQMEKNRPGLFSMGCHRSSRHNIY